MKGKKPQPKQVNQGAAAAKLQIPDQKASVQVKQVTLQPKPEVVIEPPKPKVKLGLQDLKSQWEQFSLDKDVKNIIEEAFNSIKNPMQQDISKGRRVVPESPIDNFDLVIKKQKAKLQKHEFNEGLIHLRLRHNLLSQKEYQDRKNFIQANSEQLPEKEKELQDKFGLKDYFNTKQANIIRNALEPSQSLAQNKSTLLLNSNGKMSKLDLDLSSSKQLIPSASFLQGSMTERGKSQRTINRDKSQPVHISMMNFKNQEEKVKHEEFIKKLKDEEKQRKKLRKQLEHFQQQKVKSNEDKLNLEKEKQDNEKKEKKKKRFLEMQEILAKKERDRQEQKEKQDEELHKLLNYQPLHVKMESQYKNEVEMPLLEQKKKKLEEIRQFFKQPLDKQDIAQHMKKYENDAEQKQREREKRKQEMHKEFYQRDQNIHESKAVEDDLRRREEEEEKQQQRKQVQQRMNEYFESIKGTISFKDDSIIKKNKHKNDYILPSKSLKGSQSARGLPILRASLQSQYSTDILNPNPSRSTNRMHDKNIKDIVWKSDFTKDQESKTKREQELFQIKNDINKKSYLKNILNQNEGKKKLTITDINQYLDDNNISDRERFDLVKLRAQQIEEKARLDEKLLIIDDNDPKQVQKALEVNDLYIQNSQSTEGLFLSSHYLTFKTENSSLVLNFAYHINLERWMQENSTNVYLISNLSNGLVLNRKHNKTILIFANDTANDIFYLNNQSLYQVNTTVLNKYEEIDLYAIEIPEEIEKKFDFQNADANRTILISTSDVEKISTFFEDYITPETVIYTSFRQMQFLNCEKVSFYQPQLAFFCALYFTAFAYFFAKTVSRPGYSPNIVQRFIPVLPFLKMVYCILNFSYWMYCPWIGNNEGVNFIRSFKVTLATLFQTMLCLLFVVSILGFRISRDRLNQQDIKKMLVLTSTQYFVDSIYSLGTYIDFIKVFVTLILNAFSIFMILFVLFETKRNFDGLNYRLHIVQEQPSLRYISQAITRKKRYLATLALTIVIYFIIELSIHGVWDFSNFSRSIYDQLNVWLFHEIIDFSVIMIIGLVITISARSRLQAGESIIDISNYDFREDINRMKHVFMYQCDLTGISTSNDSDNKILESENKTDKYLKYLEEIEHDTPIIILQPDFENSGDIKICYREVKPEWANSTDLIVNINQIVPTEENNYQNLNTTMSSERNQLIESNSDTKKSCDFGNAQSIKQQQDRLQKQQQRKPGTAMSMIDEKKRVSHQQQSAKSTSQTRIQRSTSKSNGNQSLNFKTSFDNSFQRQEQNLSNVALPHNISKEHLRSFTQFQSNKPQNSTIAGNSYMSHSQVNRTHATSTSINHNKIDLSNIDSKSDNAGKSHIQSTNQSVVNAKQNLSIISNTKSSSTPYQANRHNEYNNNEEDYTKSKKDEVIKSIFKKRKEKMQSVDTPQDHHESSTSTFDGLNYQQHHHSHNLSQFDNPINHLSISNMGGSVVVQSQNLETNNNSSIHQHSQSLSKVMKDKKYRKFAAERTQTPPPPTTVTRMINTQNSYEKTLQNSNSFVISKKQTAYVKPKDPDNEQPSYNVNSIINNNARSNKIVVSSQVGKKINIKLNNFMKTSIKSIEMKQQQAISERQKRPQSQNDNMSILSSFTYNNTNNIHQTNQKQGNQQQIQQHHQSSKSTSNVQNFQLTKNINVKISHSQPLSYISSFLAHQNTVTDLQIDDNHPNILYSSSLDYSVKIWNLNSLGNENNQRQNLSQAPPQAQSVISYDPVMLSPFSNNSSNNINNRPQSTNSATSSNIPNHLLFTPQNKSIPNSLQPHHVFPNRQRQKVNTILHMSEISVLATGGYDKMIKLYTTQFNQNKFELLHTIKGGHQGVINQIRKLDSNTIASTCSDGFIRIFDLKNKKFDQPILQFEQVDSSPSIITFLNTSTFLTSGHDGGIRLWDMRESIPHIQTYHKYHNDQVTAIDRLSQHIFASSSDDSNINMWDIRMPKMLKQIWFDGDRVGSIKFIQQNHLVVAHENNLTLMGFKDNFTSKITQKIEPKAQDFDTESMSTLGDTNSYKDLFQIKAITHSEKDRQLYLAGSDMKIHVWNTNFSI